ncbi:glycosyltransferase family 4 protein [Pontibacter roseus]|uniref:glycosyltransferase family 4 protein n=1 Tax=Pontibacter roseus TaxID=336989 RepID=UPI0003A10A87|nr:glycosyltransferase family 1 protein [Pontibacter roseus]
MLAKGIEKRGHQVEIWAPKPMLHRIPLPPYLRKWLGYIDQFLLFPAKVRSRLMRCADDALFVFTDNGLGPWVPLVANRRHAIHCHDFLAQLSALGEVAEIRVGWTGRLYQAYIRRGYAKGKNFISVSSRTREELHRLLKTSPRISEVVYNGLNGNFCVQNPGLARARLGEATGLDLTQGYILHVGGNEWYKNRRGVIEIYNAWRDGSHLRLPLLLVGHKPSADLSVLHTQSPHKDDIHWLSGIDDDTLRLAYAGAAVLLFPSLAEGFGWPIAEAMACGCPVITTDEAPMTEVAGEAGFLIPRRPESQQAISVWSLEAAKVVDQILSLPAEEREKIILLGLVNAQRFSTEQHLNQVEKIYQRIVTP